MFPPLHRLSVNKPPLLTFIVLSNVAGANNSEDGEVGARSSNVRMQVDEKAIIPIILDLCFVSLVLRSRNVYYFVK